eukprot:GDKJ01059253.1.p1 GENE.GDKJ01059253.1~~GDKJ01059253.1.p1  ORF type:complete len:1081 (-),score=246.54 GDKJ01059253.1:260-3106(-)
MNLTTSTPENKPIISALLGYIRYIRGVEWMAREQVVIIGQDPTQDSGSFSVGAVQHLKIFLDSYLYKNDFPGGPPGLLRSVVIVRRPSSEYAALTQREGGVLSRRFHLKKNPNGTFYTYFTGAKYNPPTTINIPITDAGLKFHLMGANGATPNLDMVATLTSCARERFHIDEGFGWGNLAEIVADTGSMSGHSMVLAMNIQSLTISLSTDLSSHRLQDVSDETVASFIRILECHQRKLNNMLQELHHASNSYLFVSSFRYNPLSILLLIPVCLGLSPLLRCALSLGSRTLSLWMPMAALSFLSLLWSVAFLVTLASFSPSHLCRVVDPNPLKIDENVILGVEAPGNVLWSVWLFRVLVSSALGLPSSQQCFQSKAPSLEQWEARERNYIASVLLPLSFRFILLSVCSLRALSRLMLPESIFYEITVRHPLEVPPMILEKEHVEMTEQREWQELNQKNQISLFKSISSFFLTLRQKKRRKNLLKSTTVQLPKTWRCIIFRRHLTMLLAKSCAGVFCSCSILVLALNCWPLALLLGLTLLPCVVVLVFGVLKDIDNIDVEEVTAVPSNPATTPIAAEPTGEKSSLPERSLLFNSDAAPTVPTNFVFENQSGVIAVRQCTPFLAKVTVPILIFFLILPPLLYIPVHSDSWEGLILFHIRSSCITLSKWLILSIQTFESSIPNSVWSLLYDNVSSTVYPALVDLPPLSMAMRHTLFGYEVSFSTPTELGLNFWGGRWLQTMSLKGMSSWVWSVCGVYVGVLPVIIHCTLAVIKTLRKSDFPQRTLPEYPLHRLCLFGKTFNEGASKEANTMGGLHGDDSLKNMRTKTNMFTVNATVFKKRFSDSSNDSKKGNYCHHHGKEDKKFEELVIGSTNNNNAQEIQAVSSALPSPLHDRFKQTEQQQQQQKQNQYTTIENTHTDDVFFSSNVDGEEEAKYEISSHEHLQLKLRKIKL